MQISKIHFITQVFIVKMHEVLQNIKPHYIPTADNVNQLKWEDFTTHLFIEVDMTIPLLKIFGDISTFFSSYPSGELLSGKTLKDIIQPILNDIKNGNSLDFDISDLIITQITFSLDKIISIPVGEYIEELRSIGNWNDFRLDQSQQSDKEQSVQWKAKGVIISIFADKKQLSILRFEIAFTKTRIVRNNGLGTLHDLFKNNKLAETWFRYFSHLLAIAQDRKPYIRQLLHFPGLSHCIDQYRKGLESQKADKLMKDLGIFFFQVFIQHAGGIDKFAEEFEKQYLGYEFSLKAKRALLHDLYYYAEAFIMIEETKIKSHREEIYRDLNIWVSETYINLEEYLGEV